jgi:CHAT domain-containing protein
MSDQENPHERAEALWLCAEEALSSGLPEAAIQLLDACLSVAGIPTELRAGALLDAGCAAMQAGQLEAAENHFAQILQLPGVPKMTDTMARVNLIGLHLSQVSTLSNEEREFLLSDAALAVPLPAVTRLNRAAWWRAQGSDSVVLEELDHAVLSSDDQSADYSPWIRVSVRLLRSEVLATRGRRDEARADLDAALALEDRLAPTAVAGLWYRLGLLFLGDQDYASAQDCFRTSLNLVEFTPGQSAQRGLARYHLAVCMYIVAKDEYATTAAVEDVRAMVEDDHLPIGLRALSRAFCAGLDDNIAELIKAATALEDSQQPWNALDTWDDASRAAQLAQDLVLARSCSERSVQLLFGILSALNDDAAWFEVQVRALFASAQLVSLLTPDHPQEGLAATIRAKSAATLRLLNSRAGTDSRVAATFEQQRAALTASRAVGVPFNGELFRSGSNLAAAVDLAAIEGAHREFTRLDPVAARLAATFEVDPAAIIAAVPSGAAAIEYFLAGRELFVFVVHDGTVNSVGVPWNAEDDDAVLEITDQLRFGAGLDEKEALFRAPILRACLRRLHERLIAVVNKFLPPSGHLILSPGARLGAVPFLALVDTEERPLVERFDISHVLTLGQLLEKHTEPWRNSGQLALLRGDDCRSGMKPLRHANDEVRAVLEWARKSGRPVFAPGVDAERVDVLPGIAKAHILHYVGHASFATEHAMASAIFPPGGPLTPLDVLNMDLDHVGMCVLSGCETGRSAEGVGDEFVGFLRALFARGVGGVLCSTWLADDEFTAILMRKFYEHLESGTGPSAALCNVVRMVRSSPEYRRWAHPFFWGNFRYFGAN